jgi:hypothetical protein
MPCCEWAARGKAVSLFLEVVISQDAPLGRDAVTNTINLKLECHVLLRRFLHLTYGLNP